MATAEDDVTPEEQEDAHERSAPSGKVVYHAIIEEGEDELRRPTRSLFWSGIAAGMSMGFSAIAESILTASLPATAWRDLITKLGYSVGFLVVILGRQQLFTENTLTPILPLLQDFSTDKLRNVLRLWSVVLVANLLGAALVAYALSFRATLKPEVYAALIEISKLKYDHDFLTVLWRGVFAGWLLALMVWLLPYAEVARFWVIILITYLVGIGEFSHVVAGSVQAFSVVIHGDRTWFEALTRFVLPALIGNILGGVTLVAALNYAQHSSNHASK